MAKLNKHEKALLEAIKSMLDDDSQLGLSVHDLTTQSSERGYEYLHNHIDQLFELKSSDLTMAEAVNQAFHKIHSYKYVDDPTFKTAMEKELVAQAVPKAERDKALNFVDKVIDEIQSDKGQFDEKDFGLNPDMEEIRNVSQTEQPLDFDIHDKDGYNEANVEWDKGNASPSRTPDEP